MKTLNFYFFQTMIIYFLWFSTSLIYYGLTLNSNDFGASLFVYYSFGKGNFVKIQIMSLHYSLVQLFFYYFSYGISGNHLNDFLLITSRTPHYFIDALYHLWSRTFRHDGYTNVRLTIELKPAESYNFFPRNVSRKLHDSELF